MSIIGNLKFKKSQGTFDFNSFAQEIEEAYLSRRKQESFTQKKTFSPSTVGYGHGNCPRYWFIAFTGTEFDDTFTAKGMAAMWNGTQAHDRIQEVIGKTSYDVVFENEVKYEDPPIRGFVDFIISTEDGPVVGEIKTAKDEIWLMRQSKMAPSGNHLLQLLIYMKILKAAEGVFVYENKNDHETLFIPIRVNERYIDIINELFDWLREVRAAYDNNTLPEKVSTKGSTMCKNCPVKKTCWAELGDGEIQIKKYEPPK